MTSGYSRPSSPSRRTTQRRNPFSPANFPLADAPCRPPPPDGRENAVVVEVAEPVFADYGMLARLRLVVASRHRRADAGNARRHGILDSHYSVPRCAWPRFCGFLRLPPLLRRRVAPATTPADGLVVMGRELTSGYFFWYSAMTRSRTHAELNVAAIPFPWNPKPGAWISW